MLVSIILLSCGENAGVCNVSIARCYLLVFDTLLWFKTQSRATIYNSCETRSLVLNWNLMFVADCVGFTKYISRLKDC